MNRWAIGCRIFHICLGMQRRQLVGNHLFTLQQCIPVVNIRQSTKRTRLQLEVFGFFVFGTASNWRICNQRVPFWMRFSGATSATFAVPACRLQTWPWKQRKNWDETWDYETSNHQTNYIRLRNSPSPVTHSLIFANAWCLDVPGLLAQVQCPYQAWCGTAKGGKVALVWSVVFLHTKPTCYMCGTKLQYCM